MGQGTIGHAVSFAAGGAGIGILPRLFSTCCAVVQDSTLPYQNKYGNYKKVERHATPAQHRCHGCGTVAHPGWSDFEHFARSAPCLPLARSMRVSLG
jgi:hypothetical protein